MKLRMRCSIAGYLNGELFSAQPGEVISVDAKLGGTWVRSGHGEQVPEDTPTTAEDDTLRDLSLEEAMTHRCFACDRARAKIVFTNRPYCLRCGISEMHSGVKK